MVSPESPGIPALIRTKISRKPARNGRLPFFSQILPPEAPWQRVHFGQPLLKLLAFPVVFGLVTRTEGNPSAQIKAGREVLPARFDLIHPFGSLAAGTSRTPPALIIGHTTGATRAAGPTWTAGGAAGATPTARKTGTTREAGATKAATHPFAHLFQPLPLLLGKDFFQIRGGFLLELVEFFPLLRGQLQLLHHGGWKQNSRLRHHHHETTTAKSAPWPAGTTRKHVATRATRTTRSAWLSAKLGGKRIGTSARRPATKPGPPTGATRTARATRAVRITGPSPTRWRGIFRPEPPVTLTPTLPWAIGTGTVAGSLAPTLHFLAQTLELLTLLVVQDLHDPGHGLLAQFILFGAMLLLQGRYFLALVGTEVQPFQQTLRHQTTPKTTGGPIFTARTTTLTAGSTPFAATLAAGTATFATALAAGTTTFATTFTATWAALHGLHLGDQALDFFLGDLTVLVGIRPVEQALHQLATLAFFQFFPGDFAILIGIQAFQPFRQTGLRGSSPLGRWLRLGGGDGYQAQ